MEKHTPHYVVVCLKPSCRFRYPTTLLPEQTVCPKCGSPVQVLSFPVTDQVNEPISHHVGIIEVLLDNIRSAYNAGSILRTSDAMMIRQLYCCGTTPTPDQSKVQKTALGAGFSIPWSMEWNALDVVERRKQEGARIVSLELASNAVSLFDLQPSQLAFPLVLVLGSEVTGVDREILDRSDLVIEIPMLGTKGSVNVATAFGVAAYFLRYLENSKENPH